MKFWKAMKALEEGKKVRSKDWPQTQWVAKRDMAETFGRSSVDEWELYEEPTLLSDFGTDPPAELPPVNCVNVNGREEHEALLKNPQKCKEHGLDIFYETMVYLKRWGGWLNE